MKSYDEIARNFEKIAEQVKELQDQALSGKISTEEFTTELERLEAWNRELQELSGIIPK